MMRLLQLSWHSNSVEEWLSALGLASTLLLVLIVLRGLFLKRVRRWAERSTTQWDDVLVAALTATHALTLLIVAVYAGSKLLTLNPRLDVLLDRILILTLMLQVGLWGSRAIRAWRQGRFQRGSEGDVSETGHLDILAFVLSLVLWVVVVLAALNNLGFDITALVASLGIGGVAVALAVQNILGDLFASLSIALDKPFVVGDFIVVDDLMGTVKHIGLKTTRLQSLGGEELVFSNNDLLKSRVRNYKRMAERRVEFRFGLRYDTPRDAIVKLPALLREIVEAQKPVRFDRAHFKALGEFRLEFEVAYYVLSADYNLYMDIQQAINLEIMARCADLGVAFAFPTRTLLVDRLPPEAQGEEPPAGPEPLSATP